MCFTSWAQQSCFRFKALWASATVGRRSALPGARLRQKCTALSRHDSCCWKLPTAQRPRLLPPLQKPRKQSDAAAAAILLGRGLGRRIGASSLFLFPSSIGYLLLSSDADWLRKFTFFGGLLLRRSESFDPLHLFVEVRTNLVPLT